MNKKYELIYKLIAELVIMGFFLFSFINNNIFINFMFIPFIICISSDIIKNILLLKGENVNNRLFEKIFIIGFLSFVFLFLILWTGLSILSKDYSLIIASIPFWIIGIFLVKNYLEKKLSYLKNLILNKYFFIYF